MSRPTDIKVIPGGYFLLARKIIESEIWKKPPLYLKVWVYLLARAQHSKYKGLNRGQLVTSIPEIQEECSWQIGFRKEKPTKDQIFQVLEWMRNAHESNAESNDESNARATMIATTKATHKMVITIENYCVYQDSKNYESNGASNNESVTKATMNTDTHPDNINKNDNNANNENNNMLSQQEKDILGYLKTIAGYPFDYETDLKQIREWLTDFPQKDIFVELKSWAVWMRDNQHKIKTKINYRSRFNNWLKPKTWEKKQKQQEYDGPLGVKCNDDSLGERRPDW